VTSNLFSLQLNAGQLSTLSLLNEVNIFGIDLLHGLLWQTGLILLCIGWFLSWKVWGEPAPLRIKNNQ
jgi:hypothetical protein